ncbi:hypothetical protein [Zavarzinella formosa]|nr:hypothetical protein [Zavarzinella formosa]
MSYTLPPSMRKVLTEAFKAFFSGREKPERTVASPNDPPKQPLKR